jgi:hypothetical protein
VTVAHESRAVTRRRLGYHRACTGLVDKFDLLANLIRSISERLLKLDSFTMAVYRGNEASKKVVEETKRLYADILSKPLDERQLAKPGFKFIQDVAKSVSDSNLSPLVRRQILLNFLIPC